MKFILLLSTLLSFSAVATECAKDVKKFCDGVEPGRGQMAKCLADYEAQLSPACAAELKDFKKNVGKKQPCFEDLTEFCSDIPSDPHNFEYCLLKNETRLSPSCSADFKKKKGNIIVRNPCAQDITNTCYKEVSGPEGGVTRCLIRNKAKLSGFCQKSIDKKIADMRKKNACFDDTEKFCPTQLKFIDIQDCLSKKLTALTPGCQALVKTENEKLNANPCYRDLVTHCKPRLAPVEQQSCLTLNEEHLSNACKQYRVVEKTKIEKMEKLCEQDRLKLCPTAPIKNGGIVKCLRQNKPKVSKDCAALL